MTFRIHFHRAFSLLFMQGVHAHTLPRYMAPMQPESHKNEKTLLIGNVFVSEIVHEIQSLVTSHCKYQQLYRSRNIVLANAQSRPISIAAAAIAL